MDAASSLRGEPASNVRFIVPDVRLPGYVFGALMSVIGVGTVITAFGNDGIKIWSLAFGLIELAIAAGLVASTARGYAITVTDSSVKLHRLWTREIPFEQIATVKISDQIMRTISRRVCLEFEFVDGSTYLFKDFNGSIKQTSESYRRVYEAMLLIRQRLADAHMGETGLQARAGQVEIPAEDSTESRPPPSPASLLERLNQHLGR